MASSMFSKKLMDSAARWYQKTCGKELNKMGLRWEDLVSQGPAVKEALELADPEVIKGRERRLKRASDLTFKGKSYTDYKSTDNLEPFKLELWEDIQKIEAREEEYAVVDMYKK